MNIHRENLVVADFGCGDAALAKKLQTCKSKRFAVHSYDLVAGGPNAELITEADISNVPLQSYSADVGVFCLSLMGTNLADFLREAYRVLKDGGVLYIAEVRSRFESNPNDLKVFVKTLEQCGFVQQKQLDRSNTMFLFLELTKNAKIRPNKHLEYTAKPCIYKRR